MIKYLEKTGRTMEEAIAAALAELGLSEEEISVEVLERAKSGFLGIGAQPAVIRVSYEVPDEPAPAKKEVPAPKKAEEKKAEPKKAEKKAAPAPKKPEEKKAEPKKAEKKAVPADEDAEFAAVRGFISGLMERMGVEAEIEIARRDNGGINVKLSGSGMGAIIGRRGETLDAIQHLTNYVVNRDSDKHMHISVDAENYRAKREESLTKLAEKMAEKAIKYKRSMALEPMNSYERHVIHTALQNYEGVTTSSTGVEPNRRVVVSYVRPEPSDNKPQSREWA
ncbi:MAG: Jag N-terminal domain-containing protein [Oscillospiraceae bacterium]|nr:Jag N-terminal domain-containing protein [Oscillospiraceae bacterium]